MKTLLELAKELDFETEYDYFGYVLESYINGQNKQSRRLFEAIPSNDIEQFERTILDLANEETVIDLLKYLGYSKTKIENVYFNNWQNVPHFNID